jgi:hypothetical protein
MLMPASPVPLLEEPVPDAGLDHCAGAPASGHGQEKRASDAALGRSRGGLTTKIPFAHLKQFHRLATRFDRIRDNFKATLALTCAWLFLKLYVDTP